MSQTTKIREVLKALAAVQSGLSIEEPAQMKVARVYPYPPPGQDAIETPCFVNQWRFVSEMRRPNSFREMRYVIRSQVLVAESGVDFERYAECAAALHDVFVEALDSQLQLDGAVSLANLRGDEAEYMPVMFDRGDAGRYIGLQYLIDVTINDVSNFGP